MCERELHHRPVGAQHGCGSLSSGPPHIPALSIDDVPFVAAAIEAGADYLVSDDKDILTLAPLKDVSIATPREFLGVISKIRPL